MLLLLVCIYLHVLLAQFLFIFRVVLEMVIKKCIVHLLEIITFQSGMSSCRLECLLAHILQPFVRVQHYEITSLTGMDPVWNRAGGPQLLEVSMHNTTLREPKSQNSAFCSAVVWAKLVL